MYKEGRSPLFKADSQSLTCALLLLANTAMLLHNALHRTIKLKTQQFGTNLSSCSLDPASGRRAERIHGTESIHKTDISFYLYLQDKNIVSKKPQSLGGKCNICEAWKQSIKQLWIELRLNSNLLAKFEKINTLLANSFLTIC